MKTFGTTAGVMTVMQLWCNLNFLFVVGQVIYNMISLCWFIAVMDLVMSSVRLFVVAERCNLT
jgi:hypothetical protein